MRANMESNFLNKTVYSIIFIFLTVSGCDTQGDDSTSGNLQDDTGKEVSFTTPVAWGKEIEEDRITINHEKGSSGIEEELVWVRLVFENIPEQEEGEEFTLIGGGLGDTGLHGPNATGFEGKGYHFALPEGVEGENPERDEAYKQDYTRVVENGSLVFDFYYHPTNINEWGERYFPGTEVALTLMRRGSEDRVLHATNNDYNWAIANVGKGNAAEIIVDVAE